MTGLSTDYECDCKVNIGSYVEASTDMIVTNDNAKRTRSCVDLGPVGNRQGSIKCFDIESEKMFHHRTVTQLPWLLDNRLVKKVEVWGKKEARAIKRAALSFSIEKERNLIGKIMTFLSWKWSASSQNWSIQEWRTFHWMMAPTRSWGPPRPQK